MKNTEQDAINAITEALMGQPMNLQYRATGQYSNLSRRIELDYGAADVGPLIGSCGSMKLAIQTLLACPFGGDACQLVIKTTRADRRDANASPNLAEKRIEGVLAALQAHYPPGRLKFRLERSPSAVVVLIESTGLFIDDMRGALAKTIRAIGRRHGMVAVVSIETPAIAGT